jgi:hypothetical protein
MTVPQNDDELLALVAEVCGASSAHRGRHIQTLWSGYGELFAAHLRGGQAESVIIKRVSPPGGGAAHPRGWNSDRSHTRKLRSYAVEMAFYQDWADRCGPGARVPACHYAAQTDSGWVFIMENLDIAGFPERHGTLNQAGLRSGLEWLAGFHARFMGVAPEDLWPEGAYWHLETRPDELEATADASLKRHAAHLDAQLGSATFRTLIHGDAKTQNLCFGPDQKTVAAVDFQYVGGGCGMKDVAYFFSSCLSESACERQGPELLEFYFEALRAALPASFDADALEAEWRALYPVAWADFARFLSGWAPEHWKLHGYTRRMVELACG